ncbi:MAG: hypothetical protein LBG23_05320 [Endomicrobium sp.]|nr:hypothetical protein [Endomicrobium sp.]
MFKIKYGMIFPITISIDFTGVESNSSIEPFSHSLAIVKDVKIIAISPITYSSKTWNYKPFAIEFGVK